MKKRGGGQTKIVLSPSTYGLSVESFLIDDDTTSSHSYTQLFNMNFCICSPILIMSVRKALVFSKDEIRALKESWYVMWGDKTNNGIKMLMK